MLDGLLGSIVNTCLTAAFSVAGVSGGVASGVGIPADLGQSPVAIVDTLIDSPLAGAEVFTAAGLPGVETFAVLATGDYRFDRRHALPSHWKELEVDLARPLGSPLDRSSTIVRLLLDVDRRSNVTVQPLTGLPADGEPERSAQWLDALLKGMSARPETRSMPGDA